MIEIISTDVDHLINNIVNGFGQNQLVLCSRRRHPLQRSLSMNWPVSLAEAMFIFTPDFSQTAALMGTTTSELLAVTFLSNRSKQFASASTEEFSSVIQGCCRERTKTNKRTRINNHIRWLNSKDFSKTAPDVLFIRKRIRLPMLTMKPFHISLKFRPLEYSLGT